MASAAETALPRAPASASAVAFALTRAAYEVNAVSTPSSVTVASIVSAADAAPLRVVASVPASALAASSPVIDVKVASPVVRPIVTSMASAAETALSRAGALPSRFFAVVSSVSKSEIAVPIAALSA